MRMINWGALYYDFILRLVRNRQPFRMSLDDKRKINLKLLRDKILSVNNFLLFTFVLHTEISNTHHNNKDFKIGISV